MSQPLRKAWNRVRNMISFGSVNVVDDTGPVQIAQVQIGTLETRDNTPMPGLYGFSSNPPPGTKVVLAFVSGLKGNGSVVGMNSPAFRRRGQKPGETSIHDNIGQFIYLSADGIVIQANNLPVVINGATSVTINAADKIRCVTPRLECTGDILDNCDTQAETMAAQRQVYNGHDHPAPGGTTGPPNQREP